MSIKPVAKTRVTNEVAQKLQALILSGEYKPGDRLPAIKELAAALEVGQTTVREGLRHLESIGMVRLRQGSGVYVSDSIQFPLVVRPISPTIPVSRKTYSDLLVMRQILETGAAALAATSASKEGIERLGDLLAKMEESSDNPERFSDYNAEFHMCVAEITGNEIIPQILKAVREIVVMHQKRLNTSPELRARSLEYHRAIYRSIAAGDAEAARRAMAEHLNDVAAESQRTTGHSPA